MAKELEYWQKIAGQFVTSHLEMAFTIINQLKNIDSPIEKITYMMLVQSAYSYGMFNFIISQQYPISKYKVDFMVEYNGQRVVIECDGHDYHERTKEQASRDKKRDRELQKLGYVVLRYTGTDIYRDPQRVCYDLHGILGSPDWVSKDDENG